MNREIITPAEQESKIKRLKWLETRSHGIGGSDAAKVLGLSRYGGPLDVYINKTTPPVDIEPSEAAYFGTQLEEFVAQEFSKRSGLTVERHERTEFDAADPFMLANVDRVIVGENAGLECKTASAFKADEWEGDAVPDEYYVQVQHYCAVMDWDGCYIACLIGGQRFVFKFIPKNADFIADMRARERDFWVNHVIPRIPPAPTVTDSVYLPQTASDMLTATDEDTEYARRLSHTREQIKSLTEYKEILEAVFKARIAENAGISGIATFKQNKDRLVTDWEAVAKAMDAPEELIREHTEIHRGARVFRFNFQEA